MHEYIIASRHELDILSNFLSSSRRVDLETLQEHDSMTYKTAINVYNPRCLAQGHSIIWSGVNIYYIYFAYILVEITDFKKPEFITIGGPTVNL